MANIVIVESKPDLFDDIVTISQGMSHLITRVSNYREVISGDSGSKTDLVVLNKTADQPIDKLFTCISKCMDPPKVLVVVDKPDILELEFALRQGALDYIRRDNALDLLPSLLGRLETSIQADDPSWEDVGERFNIYGKCPQMRTCFMTVAKASRSDVSVLIHGETGTGKELFARAIHGMSRRRDHQLIVVDCASLPGTLVESVLFGYSKGAFTGADSKSEGLILRAHQGTLFLDEVSELPLELQKKFLRVLQERRFRPVGGKQEVESDFRLVAATNKDLSQMVKDGHFRSDLLYRLQSLKLNLPPLRQRAEDIEGLVVRLLRKSCEKNRMPIKGPTKEFLDVIAPLDWPGNVRELENVLDSVVAVSHGQDKVYPEQLPFYIRIKAAKRNISTSPACPASSLELRGAQDVQDLSQLRLPSYKQYRNEALETIEEQYFSELFRRSQGDISVAMGMASLSRARLYEFYKKYNLTGQVRAGNT